MAVDGHGYLYASFQHTDVVLRFNSSNSFRVRKKIKKIFFSFVIIFVIVLSVLQPMQRPDGLANIYFAHNQSSEPDDNDDSITDGTGQMSS